MAVEHADSYGSMASTRVRSGYATAGQTRARSTLPGELRTADVHKTLPSRPGFTCIRPTNQMTSGSTSLTKTCMNLSCSLTRSDCRCVPTRKPNRHLSESAPRSQCPLANQCRFTGQQYLFNSCHPLRFADFRPTSSDRQAGPSWRRIHAC